MTLSRIPMTSSSTKMCISRFKSSGVESGIRQPAWILPWYSETSIRTFWLGLRKFRYFSQSQQMRLETPIFIGVVVRSDSRALSARVSSQWQDVVTVSFSVGCGWISGNLTLTSSAVTCSWSFFVASSLSKAQILFGICNVWEAGGTTYKEVTD